MTDISTSPETDQIAIALGQFQAKAKPIKRDTFDDKGESYASLETIVQQTRRALGQFGLSVVQWQGQTTLITMLLHKSGQWISGAVDCMGAEQYGRRSGYLAILGLVQGPPIQKPTEMQADVQTMLVGKPPDVIRALAPLSLAQQSVLLRKHKDDVALIAAADKLRNYGLPL